MENTEKGNRGTGRRQKLLGGGNSFLSLEKPDIYYSDITIGICPVYIKAYFSKASCNKGTLTPHHCYGDVV
jgi:hypothetical protein